MTDVSVAVVDAKTPGNVGTIARAMKNFGLSDLLLVDPPVLNLGQAATIVLYELRDLTLDETQLPESVHERATEREIEGLYDQFDAFVAASGHPEEKHAKAGRLFRRLVGRAHPTGRETVTLRGILRRATNKLE